MRHTDSRQKTLVPGRAQRLRVAWHNALRHTSAQQPRRGQSDGTVQLRALLRQVTRAGLRGRQALQRFLRTGPEARGIDVYGRYKYRKRGVAGLQGGRERNGCLLHMKQGRAGRARAQDEPTHRCILDGEEGFAFQRRVNAFERQHVCVDLGLQEIIVVFIVLDESMSIHALHIDGLSGTSRATAKTELAAHCTGSSFSSSPTSSLVGSSSTACERRCCWFACDRKHYGKRVPRTRSGRG